jgi:phosphatidylethanolamine-binding protein (PEBP) family uncharacterized protein
MRDSTIGFLHWVIWDIPGNVLGLPAGVEGVYQPANPAGAKQGSIAAGLVGYFGPCSPTTVNTYEFTVYALPQATLPGLSQTSTLAEAREAIIDAALGQASISGQS